MGSTMVRNRRACLTKPRAAMPMSRVRTLTVWRQKSLREGPELPSSGTTKPNTDSTSLSS